MSDSICDIYYLQGDPRYLHSSMDDNPSDKCDHVASDLRWAERIPFLHHMGVHTASHISMDKSVQHPFCHRYYYCPGLNSATLQLVQLEHSDSIYLRG